MTSEGPRIRLLCVCQVSLEGDILMLVGLLRQRGPEGLCSQGSDQVHGSLLSLGIFFVRMVGVFAPWWGAKEAGETGATVRVSKIAKHRKTTAAHKHVEDLHHHLDERGRRRVALKAGPESGAICAERAGTGQSPAGVEIEMNHDEESFQVFELRIRTRLVLQVLLGLASC